jgi:hypothetical protein
MEDLGVLDAVAPRARFRLLPEHGLEEVQVSRLPASPMAWTATWKPALIMSATSDWSKPYWCR